MEILHENQIDFMVAPVSAKAQVTPMLKCAILSLAHLSRQSQQELS
jgi:hypothetical protein